MSFRKGYAYIVKSNDRGHWYIVRQASMKGWVAIEFAHLTTDWADNTLKGNGVVLWADLDVAEHKAFRESTDKQAMFRKSMFNILKYGRLDD